MSHLPGDPIRVFTSRQPEGRGRMTGLVGAPPAQTQVAQQRVSRPSSLMGEQAEAAAVNPKITTAADGKDYLPHL